MAEHQIHPFPPLYDSQSRILILGSFPSVKSREGQFFYHHPQNRFWKVLSAVLGEVCPVTIAEKSEMLHRRQIALWDVIGSCRITGSSDSSVRDVIPNDLSPIFREARIRAVFCNGATAWNVYQKYTRDAVGVQAVKLPSTSPANAAWSAERLEESWSQILPFLEEHGCEK